MKPPQRLLWRISLLVLIGACGLGINITVNEKEYGLAGSLALMACAAGVIEILVVGKPSRLLADNRLHRSVFNKLVNGNTLHLVRTRVNDLRNQLGLQVTTTVSMTIHLAVRRNDCADCQISWSLVQILDYVGHRSTGQARVTPDVKGIIGRCFRTGTPHSVTFHNAQEYTRLMSREFGYYAAESNFHDTEGRSYLCCPIGQEGAPLGVFYIYSTQPDVFPDNAANYGNLQAIQAACNDIAHLLGEDPLVQSGRIA